MDRTILVVDDDKKIVSLVALYLKNEGYQVIPAYDGEEAINQVYRSQPDLVILDLMLPKLNGLEVCQVVREKSDVPIIMLTARTTEEDKILGLTGGADDYVTKPFSPRELVARVGSVLRRSESDTKTRSYSVTFGDLNINFMRHEATLGNEVIKLTPTEYRLLETMVRQPGRSFSRQELIDHVFGFSYEGLERTVDVHVMNLRKKLNALSGSVQYVVTVPGHGYRFEGSHE